MFRQLTVKSLLEQTPIYKALQPEKIVGIVKETANEISSYTKSEKIQVEVLGFLSDIRDENGSEQFVRMKDIYAASKYPMSAVRRAVRKLESEGVVVLKWLVLERELTELGEYHEPERIVRLSSYLNENSLFRIREHLKEPIKEIGLTEILQGIAESISESMKNGILNVPNVKDYDDETDDEYVLVDAEPISAGRWLLASSEINPTTDEDAENFVQKLGELKYEHDLTESAKKAQETMDRFESKYKIYNNARDMIEANISESEKAKREELGI